MRLDLERLKSIPLPRVNMSRSRVSLSIIGILVIIAVLVVASLPGPDAPIVGFDEERAFQDEAYLLSMGSRLEGSEANLRGVDYLVTEFEEMGLTNVHVERFERLLFGVDSVGVAVIPYRPILGFEDPTREAFHFTHLTDLVLLEYCPPYHWSSPDDDLEVVYIGDGTSPDQFRGVEGKAVLIDHELPPRDLQKTAYKAGARMVIVWNQVYNEHVDYSPIAWGGTVPETYPQAGFPDIPVFSVSKAAGQNLMDMMDVGARIRADIQTRLYKGDVTVVIGDMEGETDPDSIILLGGHHDTPYNTVGSTDNTAGTVAVLETARQLAPYRTGKTLRFVGYGGEEMGLLGSRAYYAAYSEEWARDMHAVVNFDIPDMDPDSGGSGVLRTSDNATVKVLDDIWAKVLKDDPTLGIFDVHAIHAPEELKNINSDQKIFAQNNITAGYCAGYGVRFAHTRWDTLDVVHPDSWAVSGRVWGSWMLDEAGFLGPR